MEVHGIAWYIMIPSCIETRLRVNIVAIRSKKIKITFLEEIHICRNTETLFIRLYIQIEK